METREFKALTICQPYAHLIMTPTDQLPRDETQKRIENRKWFTAYRGPLAIHAGKSHKFLRVMDATDFPAMDFGAIVGTVDLVACLPIAGRFSLAFAWVKDDPHAEGPYCWVLENPRPLLKPFPIGGKLGVWTAEIPISLLT